MNLSEMTGKVIEFKQNSFLKRYYELRYENIVLGTIQITGFFGQRVLVNLEGKNWEIYKPSFWKSETAVRPLGCEIPIAKFIRKGFGKTGLINLERGQSLKVVFPAFKPRIEIQTEDGLVITSLKFKVSFVEKAEIHIEHNSTLLDENPWIIPLVLFVAIENRHSTIAATS